MESELYIAERHVREGEAMVTDQEIMVAELRRDGHCTLYAKELLLVLEENLQQHREGLARVRATVRAAPLGPPQYRRPGSRRRRP